MIWTQSVPVRFRLRNKEGEQIFGSLRAPFAILKRRPAQLAGVLALFLLQGAIEGVGVLLLIPLLAGIQSEGGAVGAVTNLLQPGITELGTPVSLSIVLALYVSVIAVQGFVRYKQRLRVTGLAERHKLELRTRLFRALAQADWSFHLRSRGSDIPHAIADEVSRVGKSLRQALRVTAGATRAFVYLAVALYVSRVATGAALATGLALIVTLRPRTLRARASREELSAEAHSAYSTACEFLGGMKTAKIHAEEDRHVHEFETTAASLSSAWIDTVKSHAEARFIVTTGAAIAIGLLVLAGVQFLRLQAATLLVLGYAFAGLIQRLSSIQNGLHSLASAAPAHEGVDALLTEAVSAVEPATWHGATALPLMNDVRLDRVSFQSPGGGGTPPVHEVSLEVSAHHTTAFVGPADGGKTTIADLVSGLLIPQSGEVFVDGRPLEGADLRGWRKGIGYVSQDVVFLSDTIRVNLGAEEDGSPHADLRHALRAAQLDDFVAALPHGLDTVLGERGQQLSGGERQRLALGKL